MKKHLTQITRQDLIDHPIWVDAGSRRDETLIKPCTKPLKDPEDGIFSCQFRLADGQELLGVAFNLSKDPEKREHLANFALLADGGWFFLARYHDPDYKTAGPGNLAKRLGKLVSATFPISYKLMSSSHASAAYGHGEILEKPAKKLTRAQIIAFAVP